MIANFIRQFFNYRIPEPAKPHDPDCTRRMNHAAWCGLSSMVYAERDLEFARSIGLDAVDLMVNDLSKARGPTEFDLYHTDKIRKFCEAAKHWGIDVRFTSWVMPHQKFVDGMAAELPQLMSQCGVQELTLDAEEPWTLARGAFDRQEAAEALQLAFVRQDRKDSLGITGIGYARASKLLPLTQRADWATPQCYATSTSGMSAETVVGKLCDRWDAKLARTARVGLAAYRTNAAGLRTCYAACHARPSITHITWWSLNSIRRSRSITKAIRELIK